MQNGLIPGVVTALLWLVPIMVGAHPADRTADSQSAKPGTSLAALPKQEPRYTHRAEVSGKFPYRPITLPPSLLETQPAEPLYGAVDSTLQYTEALNREYVKELDEKGIFHGFYVKLETEKDVESGNAGRSLALEWELFDDGLNESKRELKKKKLQTQLEFLQLVRDIDERRLDERLYQLSLIDNRIQHHFAALNAQYLDTLYEKRRRQLEDGYITREDYEEIAFKRDRAHLMLQHYENIEQAGVPRSDYAVLNNLEYVEFQPLDALLETAYANSYENAIQDNFVERTDFFPSWTDNLSLRLYLENRKSLLSNDTDPDTVVGLRLRVPLQTDAHRDRLIELQKASYFEQKIAIQERLRQRLDKMTSLFKFYQAQIILLAREHDLDLERRRLLETQREHTLHSLDVTPERGLDLLQLAILDKQEQALLARTKAYEFVLKIMALTRSPSLADISVTQ